MKLSRRTMLASTGALAAGCSFAEPKLDAPSVPQAVALNVAASTFRYLSFLHQFFEVEPEDKHRRTVARLEADKENPYGPTRGRYSLTLRFFGELYPMPAVSQTAEEQEAASLEIAAALLEELEADLVMVSWLEAMLLGKHGLLLPLDRFSGRMGTDLEREFFPSVLSQFRRDGALYALPVGALPLMLYYDEDHFRLHGVPPVDASWDWDDLVESAVMLTTREVDGTVARWGLIAHMWEIWWALWQNGAEAVDPDTLQCRLQEPAALEALQFMHDLIHTHRVSPPVSRRDLWESGSIRRSPPAMLYDNSPLAPSGFRTAALPRGKMHATQVRADFGIALTARTKHPDVAYTALRGLTHALQNEVAVPASRAAAARLAEIRTDLRPEEVAAIQHSLEYGRTDPLPAIHVPQLIAMGQVMYGLGNGDDVATMVNSACSVVREYQQQSA